jgi:ketosteroid isomerase-like protein
MSASMTQLDAAGARALVGKLYSAFSVGDVPGFLALLHDDVVWNEAEGFPMSDRNPYRGKQAIVEGVFARVLAEWPDFRVEPAEIVGGPEVVVVLGRYKATKSRSGKPLDVQIAHTWWLRDGKVARFQQMADTAAVARAR